MKSSSRTDWHKLASMPDEAIDASDILPIEESFFQKAQLRLPQQVANKVAEKWKHQELHNV